MKILGPAAVFVAAICCAPTGTAITLDQGRRSAMLRRCPQIGLRGLNDNF
jgi:hypothetical protein